MSQLGSFSDLSARSCEVRFTSMNGHRQADPACPKSAKSRSSSLFSKAVVLARPRLIDRLDVIGGDKLDGVLSTAANKERYECS